MNFLPVTTGFPSHTPFDMEGILLVNKPRGPTSFHIIKLLRRITGEKKIGHTGTLDPNARGLLLIAFGRATKTVMFLQEMRKVYIAKVLLGVSTETDDISGRIIARNDMLPVPFNILKDVLETFKGSIKQVPPQFSAVKYKGKRAYSLARKGEKFLLSERDITIHKIDIIYYSHPYLKIRVECSKGTYIRAIARDIGKLLNSYATLSALIRTDIGNWKLKDSIYIDSLTDRKMIEKHILPIPVVLQDLPKRVMKNPRLKKVCSVL